MKLGAIKRCCVEEKEFYIYESDCGEQWIGTHTQRRGRSKAI